MNPRNENDAPTGEEVEAPNTEASASTDPDSQENMTAAEYETYGSRRLSPVVFHTALPENGWTITRISGRVKELAGYSREEWSADRDLWRRVIHPDDRTRVIREIERSRADQSLCDLRYRIITKDGETVWVRDKAVPTVDEQGRVERFEGFIEAIDTPAEENERRLTSDPDSPAGTDDGLSDSDLYRTIVESAQDGVWRVDAAGNTEFVNSRMAEMLGQSADELLGRHFTELVHPHWAHWIRQLWDQSDRKRPERREVCFRRNDGASVWTIVSAVPMRDGYNRFVGAFATVSDITDRKRTERELHILADRLKERIKELNCLYGLSELVETAGVTLDEILEGAADMLPSSWRYPHLACGRIVLEDREHRSGADGEPVTKLRSDIIVHGRPAGFVEVGYVSSIANTEPDDVFLDEERRLIEAIGERLGRIVERRRAEEALAHSNALLEQTRRLGHMGHWEWDLESGAMKWSDQVYEILGLNPTSPPDFETFLAATHPDDREYYKKYTDAIVQNRAGMTLRYRVTVPDGRVKHVEGPVGIECDSDGRPLMLFGLIQDVTAQRRAEQALMRSRAGLKSIVEHSANGILVIDDQGIVLYTNEASTELLGYSDADLIGMHFGYPLSGGEVSEISVARSDGEIRAAEMRTAETEWEGRPCTLVMLYDITERRRFEDALQREKERAETYLQLAGSAIVALDVNGLVTLANRKACDIVGYRSEELIGTDWFENYVPGNCRHEVREVFNQAMSGEIALPESFENAVLSRSGAERLVSWLNTVVTDDNGKIVGTLAAGEDITERRRVEDALARSEERYRTLFERSTDAIIIVTESGEIVAANTAASELLGYDADEIVGSHAAQAYWNPSDRNAFVEAMAEEGSVKDFEVTLKRKDGSKRQCLVNSSAWRDPSEQTIGYFSIIRDVTDARLMEEQLRQAQKMESVGTLAGGIAHDFNNMLTIIQGYSELLLAGADQEDPARRDLEVINSTAQRGAELVRQILTFSRKVETSPRPTDLNQEVRTAEKLLSRTIPKMVDIRIIPGENLSRIHADAAQIEQIILNLAVNAEHAMPDGGTLTIETANVRLDEEYCRRRLDATPGDHVLLSISDTGHGIGPEVIERIFEPFFTTKGSGEGTGLGLAMVYGIVRGHGGHIRCSSEVGVGTTFSVYFPVLEIEDTSIETDTSTSSLGGSETVLVVDDEESIRKLAEKMLVKAGYTALAAENGREAIEVYQRRGADIDLVVLDLIMPVMGGRECLARLLEIDPNVRTVIASGYAPRSDPSAGPSVDAQAFVAKPFRAADLLGTIRRVLDEKS